MRFKHIFNAQSTSPETFNATARFGVIMQAAGEIEINSGGGTGVMDMSDSFDLGEGFRQGSPIQIRNASGIENEVFIKFSDYKIEYRNNVELSADLSNINVVDGQIGIKPAMNGVQVLNAPIITGIATVVDVVGDVDLVEGAKVEVSNFPAVEADKKYTVTYETHEITALEVAGGWTFNNGTAERLIISATKNVRLGFTDFSEGDKIPMKDLAPNQDFIFKGVAGNEIDIIKFTAVA